MHRAGIAFAITILAAAAPARAQEVADPRPPVVDTSGDGVPTPEEVALLAQLEAQRRAAEGRAAAFGALTIGGTVLIAGGVVAMIVVALVDNGGCAGMEGCPKPVEDFAPGITLVIAGAAAVMVGGILWGDADAEASSLARRVEELRHPIRPTFSLGPSGFSFGLHLSL